MSFNVRFAPESGHSEGSRGMSAYDPKRTLTETDYRLFMIGDGGRCSDVNYRIPEFSTRILS